MAEDEVPEQPRFCDRCGVSLVGLDVPHVERPCAQCGKATYLVEPGENGAGVHIRAGDSFRIPAGWLKISLDPAKSSGQLYRAGVSWYVQMLLIGDLPTGPHEVAAYVERLRAESDDLLESSELLADLDLESEAGAEEAIDRLSTTKDTREWWAFVVGGSAAAALDDLSHGRSDEAAMNIVRMQAARSMLVYVDHLEEPLWAGYKQTKAVYDLASAAARTPEEAEKIQALRPLFAALDEDVLHAWVESDVDIGTRIGVASLEEPVLKALASYHLAQFERQRHQEQTGLEVATKKSANRISAASVVVAALGVVIGLLIAIFFR
jgi:hypothetical protein